MQTEKNQKNWKARIKEWEESDQTQQQWCEEKGYSYAQFKYHRKRIKKEKKQETAKFQYMAVEKHPKENGTDKRDPVAIIRIGKMEIEIKGEAGQEFLKKLIREENAYV